MEHLLVRSASLVSRSSQPAGWWAVRRALTCSRASCCFAYVPSRMPGVDADLKRRRRVAARTLVPDARARKHLVDGKKVDVLPFNAGEAYRAHQAHVRAEREQWVAEGVADYGDEAVCVAEPAETTEPESCCARCFRLLPRSVRVKLDASVELR